MWFIIGLELSLYYAIESCSNGSRTLKRIAKTVSYLRTTVDISSAMLYIRLSGIQLMIKTNLVHLLFIFTGRHASQLFESFRKIRQIIKSGLSANF